MGDLLKAGSLWLAQQRADYCASQITYIRGESSYQFLATRSSGDSELTDEYGVRVGTTLVDFLVAATDWPSQLGSPQSGDAIVVDGHDYEVMDLGGEGCWRWSDEYRTALRIHAKGSA